MLLILNQNKPTWRSLYLASRSSMEYIYIGATICIGREMLCLPYAGFFLKIKMSPGMSYFGLVLVMAKLKFNIGLHISVPRRIKNNHRGIIQDLVTLIRVAFTLKCYASSISFQKWYIERHWWKYLLNINVYIFISRYVCYKSSKCGCKTPVPTPLTVKPPSSLAREYQQGFKEM